MQTKVNVGDVVELNESDFVEVKNTRFLADKDLDVTELQASIKTHGQTTPIVVYREWTKDHQGFTGKFITIGGRRRRMACANLKIPVKALVHETPKTECDRIRLANADNKHLTPTAMDRAVTAGMFRDAGLKQEEVAREIHCSRPYVSMLYNLLTLIYPGQVLIHQGKMTSALGREIGKLKPEQQYAEVEKVEKGICELLSWPLPRGGDDDKVQTQQQADEGKGNPPLDEAAGKKEPVAGSPADSPKVSQSVKAIKEFLVKAIGSSETSKAFVPVLTVVLAFARQDIDEDMALAGLWTKEDLKTTADEIRKQEEAKAKRETADKAAKTAEAERRKAASKAAREAAAAEGVCMLLKAGWTHTEGNDNQWKDPTGEINVRMDRAEALTVLARRMAAKIA